MGRCLVYKRTLIGSILLLVVCSYRPAVADTQDYPVYIPAGWAGIWSDRDSTYDCNGLPQGTSTDVDTLCEGSTVPVIFYGSDISGTHPLYWSGTADDTRIEVNTSFSRRVAMGIYYVMSYHMVEVRTGDVATRTIDIYGAYSNPPSPPDYCQMISGVLVRISPPAITCSPVSVKKSSRTPAIHAAVRFQKPSIRVAPTQISIQGSTSAAALTALPGRSR